MQWSKAYNTPKRWDRNLKPLAVDVGAWQKRIDEIVGLNAEGQSIIVLSWAQDITQRVFGEETPRYWTRRLALGTGYRYWRVPRWVLEKRVERGVYWDSWERSRWSISDEHGPVDKGPPPAEFFEPWHHIADHEEGEKCCTRALYSDTSWGPSGSKCWGEYRDFAEGDLGVIRQAKQEMDLAKQKDPYRPLTLPEIAEIELSAMKQVQRIKQMERQAELDRMTEFNRLHAWRIFETDPGRLHHGRWHFLRRANK